jgi:hypothetical protein
MAKQQTLTLVVPDDMADPANLVESALERYLDQAVIPARYIDDLDDIEGERIIVLIEEN